MKRAIIWIPAFFALSLSTLAQDGKAVSKQFAHTEIRLLLKNGDKVQGIARNNRFNEKREAKRFVEAHPDEKGSGIRLWFVNGTKSEVFFPQEICVRRDIVRTLSDLEFREIAAKIEEKVSGYKEPPPEEKKPEEPKPEGSKDPAKDQANAPAAPKPMTPEEAEEAARKAAEEAEGRALLEKFSPENGWGEARLEDIKRRRNNDLFPSKEEAEFEKGFSKWRKAFEAAEAERLRQLQELQKKLKELEKNGGSGQNSSG